jgi:hypothetical protein
MTELTQAQTDTLKQLIEVIYAASKDSPTEVNKYVFKIVMFADRLNDELGLVKRTS